MTRCEYYLCFIMPLLALVLAFWAVKTVVREREYIREQFRRRFHIERPLLEQVHSVTH